MRPLIGTGWKMNLTSTQAEGWLRAFVPLAEGLAGRDLFVLPPFPALWVARRELAGTRIAWGAQDLHPVDRGAHTGDVSAEMLVDLGCTYVEVGHSERRAEHGETDALVAAKVRAALRWGLTPILCVGERAPWAPGVARGAVARQPACRRPAGARAYRRPLPGGAAAGPLRDSGRRRGGAACVRARRRSCCGGVPPPAP